MSDLYRLNDELPPDIGDEVLDDEKPAKDADPGDDEE
jgi:hypothetical protein